FLKRSGKHSTNRRDGIGPFRVTAKSGQVDQRLDLLAKEFSWRENQRHGIQRRLRRSQLHIQKTVVAENRQIQLLRQPNQLPTPLEYGLRNLVPGHLRTKRYRPTVLNC